MLAAEGPAAPPARHLLAVDVPAAALARHAVPGGARLPLGAEEPRRPLGVAGAAVGAVRVHVDALPGGGAAARGTDQRTLAGLPLSIHRRDLRRRQAAESGDQNGLQL